MIAFFLVLFFILGTEGLEVRSRAQNPSGYEAARERAMMEQHEAMVLRAAAKDMEKEARARQKDAYLKLGVKNEYTEARRKKTPGFCGANDECGKECPIKEWALVEQLVRAGAVTAKCEHFDRRGKGDGATAADNLRDAFKGRPVKLSKYSNAPGGFACLSPRLARIIVAAAQHGVVQVNSLAGSSHSWHRDHYLGLAVDIGMLDGRELGEENKLGAMQVMGACEKEGATRIFNANRRCGKYCTSAASWVHCSVPAPPGSKLAAAAASLYGAAEPSVMPFIDGPSEYGFDDYDPEDFKPLYDYTSDEDGDFGPTPPPGQPQQPEQPQQPQPQGNHISISHDKENGFAASARIGKLGINLSRKGFGLSWNK